MNFILVGFALYFVGALFYSAYWVVSKVRSGISFKESYLSYIANLWWISLPSAPAVVFSYYYANEINHLTAINSLLSYVGFFAFVAMISFYCLIIINIYGFIVRHLKV